MSFNKTRFMKQKFEPREAEIELPALADWFDLPEVEEGAEKSLPTWTVRGLKGNELANVISASDKEKNLSSVIEAIGSSSAKITELKEAMGLGEDTHEDILKRLEQLVLGSVDPVVDSEVAVRLAETFPIEFYMLTNKITLLTGMGMDIKK